LEKDKVKRITDMKWREKERVLQTKYKQTIVKRRISGIGKKVEVFFFFNLHTQKENQTFYLY
jgi:hypothetical protein